MSGNKRICVIIPVHRPEPSPYEIISLSACKKQLGAYDCFLVYPEGMDASAYTTMHDGLFLKPIDAQWLSSVKQYNKLKLSLWFYRIFAQYSFMLTYELDA